MGPAARITIIYKLISSPEGSIYTYSHILQGQGGGGEDAICVGWDGAVIIVGNYACVHFTAPCTPLTVQLHHKVSQ